MTIVFTVLISSVHAADWTEKNTEKLIYAWGLRAIDIFQTLEICDDDRYFERNPLMKEHPSKEQAVLVLLGVGLFRSAIAYVLPPYLRDIYQNFELIENSYYAISNHVRGLRPDVNIQMQIAIPVNWLGK